MNKFTPGPWVISAICREYNNELMILAPEAPDNPIHICQVATSGKGKNRSVTPEQDATAALIAAAPELLEALQELMADKYLADPINAERMAKARAVVAKATGEQA